MRENMKSLTVKLEAARKEMERAKHLLNKHKIMYEEAKRRYKTIKKQLPKGEDEE